MNNDEYQVEIDRLKGLLKQALEYLPGYDMVGTGGKVRRKDYEEMNKLEKAIAREVGEDPRNYGCHGPNG